MVIILISGISYFIFNKRTTPIALQIITPTPFQTKTPTPTSTTISTPTYTPVITPTPTPTPVPTPTPTTLPNVIGTDMTIIYPSDGENLSTDKPIIIKYKISDALKKKISFKDLDCVELYLIRNDGLIEGYIGDVTDLSKTTFTWNPQELEHNAGLATTVDTPPSGQYKILILARHRTPVPAEAGDMPVDIFIDGYAKFDGYKIVSPYQDEMGKQLSDETKLISSDTSDSIFNIVSSTPPLNGY